MERLEERRLLAVEAVDDLFNLTRGDTLTGNVLADNRRGSDRFTGPPSVVLSSLPQSGDVNLRPDGSFSYQPHRADFTGKDSFSYTLSDAAGTTDTATATINVMGVVGDGFYGRAPFSLHRFFVESGPSSVINISANADTTRQTLAGKVRGPGTFTENNHKELALFVNSVRDANAFLPPIPPPGNEIKFSTSFAFQPGITVTTYSVERNPVSGGVQKVDVRAGESLTSARFSGAVFVNRVPVANPDSDAVNEDGVLRVLAPGIIANDRDRDSSLASGNRADGELTVREIVIDGRSFEVGSELELPSGARLTVERNGSYRYDPNGKFDPLRAGESGVESFQYVVTDGQATAKAAVTINVVGANDQPVALSANPLSKTLIQGESTIIDPAEQFRDPENDPIVAIEITADPSSGNATVFEDSTDGRLKIRYQPTPGSASDDSFRYRVADQFGGPPFSAEATVELTLIATPVIAGYSDDVAPRTGFFAADSFTNDSRPRFSGTAEPNASVRLVGLHEANTPPPVKADERGNWRFDELPGQLADGTHKVRVVAKSSDSEALESQEFTFTVDTTRPVLNSIGPVSPDPRSSAVSDTVHLVFSEDVSGVELGDLGLTRGASTSDLLPLSNTAIVEPVPTAFANTWSLRGIADVTDATGTYELKLDAVDAEIIDRAGNVVANSLSETFAVDVTPPRLAEPLLVSQQFAESNLPVPVTSDATPALQVSVTDQSFISFRNSVTLRLHFADDESFANSLAEQIVEFSPGADAQVTAAVTLTPTAPLSVGQHQVVVRAMDTVGKSETSGTFTFFITRSGEATLGTPGTPVLTTLYDVKAKLNEVFKQKADAFVHPWQMAFDKTTQTVWLTQEKAGGVAQFDPATGRLRAYDLKELQFPRFRTVFRGIVSSQGGQTTILAEDHFPPEALATINPDAADAQARVVVSSEFDEASGLHRVVLRGSVPPGTADGAAIAVAPPGDNPHGLSFDFNTHLTPRVWVAHRNAGGSVANIGGALEADGRLTYVDIVDDRLVTFDFDEIKRRETSPGKTIQEFLRENGFESGLLPAFHAAFTDATGDVWVSSPDAHALLRFDFDNTEPNCGLDCDSARLTVHPLPRNLTAGFPQAFHPHAFQVAVDETRSKQEGNQWVWSIDVAGSGRIALLRPGIGPGGTDLWTTWDVGPFAGASGTFVQIDDNETPGIPSDDQIIATFPVTAGTGGKPVPNPAATVGIVHRFSLVDPKNPIESAARIETWRIPKLPGSDARIERAAANQPFVDRNGEIFIIDRYGSVTRFDPDDFEADVAEVFTIQPEVGAVSIPPVLAVQLGVIAPTEKRRVDSTLFEEVVLEPTEIRDLDADPFVVDRARVDAFDQYEVSGVDPRVPLRGSGPFRGFLNAANVLYGSLSQNDLLSVTVFAESARRQMSAVPSPFAPPDGALTHARMAFQVLRDGSLVLTGRGDGILVDEQVNLLAEMIEAGKISSADTAKFSITGEANAIVAQDGTGTVHVMGRSTTGGVVQYTFTPPARGLPAERAWRHEEIFDPAFWSVTSPDARPALREHVLAEDVVPAGPLGFSVTTAAGHWLAIPVDPSQPVRDLSTDSKEPLTGRVYSAVGVTNTDTTLFGYGTNQTGNLVEYRIDADGTVTVRQLATDSRHHRMLRNVRAITTGDGVRHVFATDGLSRLVHWEIDSTGVRLRENVSQLTADSGEDFGYFPFQQPFVGRVYTYVAPLLEPDGTLRVYGTNGGDLVEFTRPPGEPWRVANLTQDTNATYGRTRPTERIPANSVFGGPSAYLDAKGGRHVLQINAEGEVVEYFTFGDQLFPGDPRAADRIHTQNINFAGGTDIAQLLAAVQRAVPSTTTQLPASHANAMREDVNRDGTVTPLDALWIINLLSRHAAPMAEFSSLQAETADDLDSFDVNGDRRVTPLDALLVINFLNREAGEVDGDAEAIEFAAVDDDEREAWKSGVDEIMLELESGSLS